MSAGVAGRRMAVIGGTGFIGSHLTEYLVREGAHVLVVARSARRLGNLSGLAGEYRFRAADILDSASVRAVLRDFSPEAVFHLAATVDAHESFAQMAAAVETNTIGTANVLDAAHRAGAEILVYADSCKVYGNGPVPYRQGQPEAPICSYAIAKAAGWRLCRLAGAFTGLAVCGLRPTFVYGPRQNPNLLTYVRDCVLQGAPVRLMGGSQTRDLLFVEDAVRAFVQAALQKRARGYAVPVGGGAELSAIEICREVMRLMGTQVEIVADGREPRLTEIWRSYCDNLEARALLGWSPKIALREGLARTLSACPLPPARNRPLPEATRA